MGKLPPFLRFAIVGIAISCGGGSGTPLPATQPAPARHELALDGTLLSLPNPGKVTLIDFWSTSCAPCTRLMPTYEAMWREKRGSGLAIIGVASDDNPGLVQEHLRTLGVTYPNVVDPEGTVRGSYLVNSLPTTMLFDRHGRLRMTQEGSNAKAVASIRETVDTLLGEH